jgi:acyl-coenzyme A thioesterase PaaI-like protein
MTTRRGGTLRRMNTSIDTDAQWHDMPNPCPFSALIGPVQRRRVGDGFVYGLRVGPQHTNSTGIMHGGVITAFLDEVIGEIVNDLGNRKHVTVQFSTMFLSKAQIGDFLECDCDIVRATRSMTFIQARLNVSGEAIASATAIFKAMRPTS